ncbi:MAG: hypothetical protein ACP5NC_04420 [Nitrososphaeria archaeon]
MKSLLLTAVVIGAVLLTVMFVPSLIFYYNTTPYAKSLQTYGPDMMPYNNGGMMAYYGQTISLQSAMVEATANPPSYVTLIPSNDSAIINSSSVHITVYAMMGSMAINVTGNSLPSYSGGDVFVIYGLINPTLIFDSGAQSVKLIITLVNLDNDMYHNFVITSIPPPYQYIIYGMMEPSADYLPPTQGGSAYTYTYSIQLHGPAQLWYICTYPGHAEDGMYGELIVK